MDKNQLKGLAVKYCLEDLTDSSKPGTFLSNLIRRLELAPDFMPEITKEYLEKAKLKTLLRYACKQISFDEYLKNARSEQKERVKQETIRAEKNRKRTLVKRLFQKYDLPVSSVEKADYQKLKTIIEKVDQGSRLDENEKPLGCNKCKQPLSKVRSIKKSKHVFGEDQ